MGSDPGWPRGAAAPLDAVGEIPENGKSRALQEAGSVDSCGF